MSPLGSKPFPLRTLVLMILALVAFVRFYCITHPRSPRREAPHEVPMETLKEK